MLAADVPSKIQLPFADAGTKNTIPVPSQISITPGAASYTDGFPPITFLDILAGGIPPDGADMNGILNAITAVQQWQSAGGIFRYDSTFSTAIGGYPKGAILQSTDGLNQWLNLADDNTNDPDTTPTNWLLLNVGAGRGTVTMHATTMDLWTQPKIIDGTGSAVTISAIANAPRAGAVRVLYPTAGTVITHGATFSVQGGASYTVAGGDALIFEAVTTSTYQVWINQVSSSSLPDSGRWTPSLFNTTNLDASTAYECTFFKIGEEIGFAGWFDADATAAAPTPTSMGMSIPIASDFTSYTDAAGTFEISSSGATGGGTIEADVINNRLTFNWNAQVNTNASYSFSGMYKRKA